MSSKYYDSDHVSDRREEGESNVPVTWFHHPPGSELVPSPQHQGGGDVDTFVRESMTLTHARPRSLASDHDVNLVVDHGRSWSRSGSRSGSRSRSRTYSPDSVSSRSRGGHTPLDRARGIVEANFTASTTGIGASIIGAVVGGFVANRASEALQNRNNNNNKNNSSSSSSSSSRHSHSHSHSHSHGQPRKSRHSPDEANVPRIASTILGAVAGGLGANVLANHIEDQHDRSRDRRAWEKRYSREEYEHRRRSSSRGGRQDLEDEEYDSVYQDGKHGRRRDVGYLD